MSRPAGSALRWLARRLALSVLVLLGAATAAFLALRLTPGDPVRVMLGGTTATPEVVAEVRAELDMDRPLIVQYGLFLAGWSAVTWGPRTSCRTRSRT
ncbi:hypothetical protein NKH77_47370 [Streptomyces sp. M19]